MTIPLPGADQCADLQLGLPRDAVDRRNEASKVQIDLRSFHRGLIRLDLGLGGFYGGERGQVILNRVVEILLAGRLLLGQRLVALDVKFGPTLNRFGVGERGLRLSQLAFSLIERGLKRPRIDLEKELALLNRSPFLIALLQQVASNLRPDVSIDQTIKRANPLRINRNILLLNLHDLDIGSAWRRAHSLLEAERPQQSARSRSSQELRRSTDSVSGPCSCCLPHYCSRPALRTACTRSTVRGHPGMEQAISRRLRKRVRQLLAHQIRTRVRFHLGNRTDSTTV